LDSTEGGLFPQRTFDPIRGADNVKDIKIAEQQNSKISGRDSGSKS
jgi:hypothetical protein